MALTTGNAALLPLPATVAIPAGGTTAVVSTTVGKDTATTAVPITATFGGRSLVGNLEVDPGPRVPAAIGVATPVDGSRGSSGGVDLSVAAPIGGSVVTLHSSNPAVASVPASVAIPAGTVDGPFGITTTPVAAPTDVTISATFAGVTISKVLTVTPTPPPPVDLQSVSLSPTTITTGTATATVTLDRAAAAGGAKVLLASSDTQLATVPASVTVPAGATTVTFPVTVPNQSKANDVSIGAVFDGVGVAGGLSVTGNRNGKVLPLLSTLTSYPKIFTVPVTELPQEAAVVLSEFGATQETLAGGQLPGGVSIVSNLRPNEFVLKGVPQRPGIYAFVLQHVGGNVTAPFAVPYVWQVTAS